MTTQLSTRTPFLIAAEINGIKEQTRKLVLNNSIEIGRRLVEVKSMVPHGEWGKWLKESVDYSQSTANNLMKIFEEYGDRQLNLFGQEAKSQALGNLSYTQAVALLGIPEEEREQFVKENKVEQMSTRELQQAIKEKQLLEKKLQESQEQAEKERLARQEIADKFSELEEKSKAHDELIQRLQSELEEAHESGDAEEVQRLFESLEKSKKELSESRAKIKELEEELKQKPIEVSATSVIEKIPEEVESELTELRRKVTEQSGIPAPVQIQKFKFCFEDLVGSFKNLLGALEEIPENEREKYKGAVTGLIAKMSERL